MKHLLLIGFLALFIFSCNFSSDDDDDTIFLRTGIGQTRSFNAHDFSKDMPYSLNAKLLAHTSLCKVWVEQGSGVDENIARTMALAYHNDIYPKMVNTFGFYYDNRIMNTMDIADYFGDGDGKLCILLLDIKDNYKKDVNDSYIAGYFWAGDFFDDIDSNVCDMIYVDVNPGEPGSRESNSTVAHEMQHMMNFVTSCVIRTDGETYVNLMDTWIDEGLSSAAEWVYLEGHSERRWSWFNQNGDGENMNGLIDKGNNFFVWDNHDENQYAILDDYATVYLFFQWLRLQASDDAEIYRNIISSEYFDYNAVTEAAGHHINLSYRDNWKELLGDWMAANYINAESGRYGYKNDPVLKNIKQPFAPGGSTSISLYPGEGVVSKIDGLYSTPANGDRIKYKNLESALLTYNVDTYNSFGIKDVADAVPEEGTITGVSASINSASGSRSIVTPLKGPFPIGARDVLRQNGYGDRPAGDSLKF